MNVPRVLLIRLSALGDVVLSTAAIQPLRAAGYSVSLVTKSEFSSLVKGHPELEEVYSFDKKNGEANGKNALLAWAKSKNFAFVIDLQNSWRTWTWKRALQAQSPVFSLRKPRLREWLILVFRLGRWFGYLPGGRAARFREAARDVLRRSGREVPPSEATLTSLFPTDAEVQSVVPLIPKGDFAVLLPASAWHSKEWPYFPELARMIAGKVPIVVLGGPNDQICETVAEAAREVSPESCSLHGRTTMRESMAVLAHARWVIGNDTGMMHVAEALGKDVTMIEGPTHLYMGFSPYRTSSTRIGLDLVCRPCSKSGKICVRMGTRKCLYGLKATEVANQLRKKGFPC